MFILLDCYQLESLTNLSCAQQRSGFSPSNFNFQVMAVEAFSGYGHATVTVS